MALLEGYWYARNICFTLALAPYYGRKCSCKRLTWTLHTCFRLKYIRALTSPQNQAAILMGTHEQQNKLASSVCSSTSLWSQQQVHRDDICMTNQTLGFRGSGKTAALNMCLRDLKKRALKGYYSFVDVYLNGRLQTDDIMAMRYSPNIPHNMTPSRYPFSPGSTETRPQCVRSSCVHVSPRPVWTTTAYAHLTFLYREICRQLCPEYTAENQLPKTFAENVEILRK